MYKVNFNSKTKFMLKVSLDQVMAADIFSYYVPSYPDRPSTVPLSAFTSPSTTTTMFFCAKVHQMSCSSGAHRSFPPKTARVSLWTPATSPRSSPYRRAGQPKVNESFSSPNESSQHTWSPKVTQLARTSSPTTSTNTSIPSLPSSVWSVWSIPLEPIFPRPYES